jgi:hypothetical protein
VQLLAARVMNALAACSANCRLIVNAGALEPVVDVLCGESAQATEVATFLLVRLVEVDSPLLLDFNMSALAMLLELLLVRVVFSQHRCAAHSASGLTRERGLSRGRGGSLG